MIHAMNTKILRGLTFFFSLKKESEELFLDKLFPKLGLGVLLEEYNVFFQATKYQSQLEISRYAITLQDQQHCTSSIAPSYCNKFLHKYKHAGNIIAVVGYRFANMIDLEFLSITINMSDI